MVSNCYHDNYPEWDAQVHHAKTSLMFGFISPYTENMLKHTAQIREADELLRRKLKGMPTRKEFDAAFFEHRKITYLASYLPAARISGLATS